MCTAVEAGWRLVAVTAWRCSCQRATRRHSGQAGMATAGRRGCASRCWAPTDEHQHAAGGVVVARVLALGGVGEEVPGGHGGEAADAGAGQGLLAAIALGACSAAAGSAWFGCRAGGGGQRKRGRRATWAAGAARWLRRRSCASAVLAKGAAGPGAHPCTWGSRWPAGRRRRCSAAAPCTARSPPGPVNRGEGPDRWRGSANGAPGPAPSRPRACCSKAGGEEGS